MPLGDVTYLNAALDAVVDSWPGSGATYRYWLSDPTGEDDPTTVEVDVTAAGLSNAAFDSADWAAAAAGTKATTAPVSLGTATSDLADTLRYWGVVDTGGLVVYSDALDDPISANDGDTPTFSPQLSFGIAA